MAETPTDLKVADGPTKDSGPSAVVAAPVKSVWWTESQKVITGWMIAVLLTPISVWVSTWITDKYKSPHPSLEGYSTTVFYEAVPADSAFIERINNNDLLASGFRRDLQMQRAVSNAQIDCAEWIDSGNWNDACAPMYIGILTGTHGELRRSMAELQHGIAIAQNSSSSPIQAALSAMSRPDQLKQMADSDKIVVDLLAELERIGKVPRKRDGEVDFTVGVLNHGDSDGVVYDTAVLEFGGKSMDIHASKFVPIKAHSYEDVKFSTGSYNRDQEETQRAWRSLVKQNADIPVKLTVNLSDHRASSQNLIVGKDQ